MNDGDVTEPVGELTKLGAKGAKVRGTAVFRRRGKGAYKARVFINEALNVLFSADAGGGVRTPPIGIDKTAGRVAFALACAFVRYRFVV